ncbi:MAG: ABC transporter substrate-binding protein [Desertimonas sp.]
MLNRRLVIAAIAALTVTSVVACGGDDSSSDASDTTAAATEDAPATTDGATGTTGAADGGSSAYPMTVEICGLDWTFDAPPERIVTTDTPMLDLALMLGVEDRIAGYFGAAEQLDPSVQDAAASLEHLGSNWPYPTLEAVLAGSPDLVLSYGYNAEAGFTPERLQEEGIGNFTVTEGCADAEGATTVESFYEDVRTLAQILDVSDEAETLIADWEARVAAVEEAAPTGEPIRVLNTGSGDPAAPFVSAGRAVANDLIRIAGGTDVFSDEDAAYLTPTWEEVVARDPELIIESSGGGEEALAAVRAYLEANPALAAMAAVEAGQYAGLSYEEGVPGPQMFNGLEKISAAIGTAAG